MLQPEDNGSERAGWVLTPGREARGTGSEEKEGASGPEPAEPCTKFSVLFLM